MKLKSETLYNTISFILKKYPSLSHNELITKLQHFENIYLRDFKYSPFLLPTIVELKDLLDGRLNPEFMEITVYFKLSKDEIKSLFETDMDVFSLMDLEILKDI